MTAGLALELAAGGDRVRLAATAARADRLAVVFRPAQRAEFGVGRVFASAENIFELQGLGSGGEEKMLRHGTVSDALRIVYST